VVVQCGPPTADTVEIKCDHWGQFDSLGIVPKVNRRGHAKGGWCPAWPVVSYGIAARPRVASGPPPGGTAGDSPHDCGFHGSVAPEHFGRYAVVRRTRQRPV